MTYVLIFALSGLLCFCFFILIILLFQSPPRTCSSPFHFFFNALIYLLFLNANHHASARKMMEIFTTLLMAAWSLRISRSCTKVCVLIERQWNMPCLSLPSLPELFELRSSFLCSADHLGTCVSGCKNMRYFGGGGHLSRPSPLFSCRAQVALQVIPTFPLNFSLFLALLGTLPLKKRREGPK